MPLDARFAKLFDLAGRTALVTGGSSGIGRAMAEALAGAGAHVLLAARGQDALELTVRAMTLSGWRASAEPVDVSDRASIAALLARLRDARRTSTSSSTPPASTTACRSRR
jgi:NAD(P)-dependent dehydrogenase (short-subunit alcohol dehydrogenase family)